MADNTTLARPYAQAIFALAEADNALGQWSGALAAAGAVASDRSFASLIDNPNVSEGQLLAFTTSVLSSVSDAQVLTGTDQGQNLLKLLIENGRLTILPEISERFDALKDEAENAVDVTITTASAISDSQQQEIVSALSTRLGRRVNASTAVDADLIGGAVIRAGDFVIDGSVRAQLTRLSATLVR